MMPRELGAIAREAGQLREDLECMRAQSALLDIQEAQLAEMAMLLTHPRRTRNDPRNQRPGAQARGNRSRPHPGAAARASAGCN